MLLGLVLGFGLLGYLLGSVPTGYWMGRWLKGIDIREHGSGSMGATNILRTLGKGPAAVVLLIDALKGAAAIGLSYWLGLKSEEFGVSGQWIPWIVILAGFLAVVGHSRPVWLKFKGGKSVATSLGILIALAWPVALACFGVWLIGLALSRIVSLSSMLAAVSAPLLMVAFQQPLAYVLFALVGGLYVVGTHRKNLERLLAGTEPQIGKKLTDPAQS